MKKLLLCILVIFIILPASFAQQALNKGSYSLAGTINYSASSYKDNYQSYDSHIFTFAPQFVYFTSNHISLGIAINYINSFQGNTNSSFSFGPSFRYYFYTEGIIPFLQAAINIGDPNLENSSGVTYGFGLTAGVNYFLSNSVAIEPSITYNHTEFSPSGSGAGSSSTSNGFKVGIGINYFIFKEK